MNENDLVCNYKKCRKPLKDVAYVTACSHVFCDEDGTRELTKSLTCPACEASLTAKFEIVRNNLQPSEQYKSMILAGLKPDVINDICARALAFWEYQSHQEKIYHEYQSEKAKERATQLEQYYERTLTQTNTELNNLRQQLTAAKKNHEETKKKYHEVSEKLMEKSRQHQKLQTMYDSMRRKFITMSSLEARERSQTPSSTAHYPNPVAGDGDARFEFNPTAGGINFPDTGDLPINKVKENFTVGLSTPRR